MSNNTDYRMVKLVDGSTIMGTITVDKDFLRSTNALELHTSQRITEFGAKEDSTLAPWLQFTDDKTFVIPRDKIMVITQADKHISHYYEVILERLAEVKEKQNQHYLPKKWKKYIDWQIKWIRCKELTKEKVLGVNKI